MDPADPQPSPPGSPAAVRGQPAPNDGVPVLPAVAPHNVAPPLAPLADAAPDHQAPSLADVMRTVAALGEQVHTLAQAIRIPPPNEAQAPTQGKWKSIPTPLVLDLQGATDAPDLIHIWKNRHDGQIDAPILGSVASLAVTSGPRNPVASTIKSTFPRPSRAPSGLASTPGYLSRDGTCVLSPDFEQLDRASGAPADSKNSIRALRKDSALEALERILSIFLRLDRNITLNWVSNTYDGSSTASAMLESIVAAVSIASSAIVEQNDEALHKTISSITSKAFSVRDPSRSIDALPLSSVVSGSIRSAFDISTSGCPAHSSIPLSTISASVDQARSSAVQFLALRSPTPAPPSANIKWKGKSSTSS